MKLWPFNKEQVHAAFFVAPFFLVKTQCAAHVCLNSVLNKQMFAPYSCFEWRGRESFVRHKALLKELATTKSQAIKSFMLPLDNHVFCLLCKHRIKDWDKVQTVNAFHLCYQWAVSFSSIFSWWKRKGSWQKQNTRIKYLKWVKISDSQEQSVS